MNTRKNDASLGQEELEAIRTQLIRLGPMHPGSLSQQYHACGNPACRCHHPTNPKKHGPYNKLTYVYRGKPVCRFVNPDHVQEIKSRLATYKTFRALIDRWIKLFIEKGAAEFFQPGNRSRSKSTPPAE